MKGHMTFFYMLVVPDVFYVLLVGMISGVPRTWEWNNFCRGNFNDCYTVLAYE
jgi:hypothetical protein